MSTTPTPAQMNAANHAARSPAKIAIMGTSVSSGNRGVLALGASLVNLCYEASGHGEMTLLLANRDNHPARFRVGDKMMSIPVVNSRMSPRARPRDHVACIVAMAVLYRVLPFNQIRRAIANRTPWIKTIVDSSFVGDVRGGDSFSDIYGLRRFLLGFILPWTVVLVKGHIVHFPQTYGPYKHPLALRLARYLLRRSLVIMARDKESRRLAQQIVGAGRQVLLSPDVAFSLAAVMPDELELDPPLAGAVPAGVIGLNVNGLMYHGGYTRQNMFGLRLDYASFLPTLIQSLLAEHPGELWFIPHTFAPADNVESDPEASRRVRDVLRPELRARIRIVSRDYDQSEIKGVIGGCDFFIGSRMHACIAGLSQGVPSVGVAYSKKFAGVFESVGMENWVVDARSVTNEQAIARIMQLYRERNAVRASLKQRADEARLKLRESFAALLQAAVESDLPPTY